MSEENTRVFEVKPEEYEAIPEGINLKVGD
jgi:hypothetical protein